jgi:hypothetical protein
VTINLPSNLSSRQDLTAAILELKAYTKWYLLDSNQKRVSGQSSFEEPAISEASRELLVGWQATKKNLDELIAELEEFKASAPHITVTLAAPAPSSLRKSIIEWCRANLNPNILVDFRFNSTMLGGMVVAYGSHVYDWSFRKQILADRQKFTEVLRRV